MHVRRALHTRGLGRLAVLALFALLTAGSPQDGEAQAAAVTVAPILTVGSPSGWSDLSGDPGLSNQVLYWTGGWVMHGVGFGERRDRPCYMYAAFSQQVKERDTDIGDRRGGEITGVRKVTESEEVRECEGGDENRSSRRYLSYSGQTMRAIHGIQVCQRRSNDRIKGIRILGSEITVNGPRPDSGLDLTEERPNCNDWNQTVRCPSGKVAVGMRVEFRGESAVGISLRCAPARLQA